MIKLSLGLLLALVPTLICIYLLIEYFPYTGLGRVLSIPSTIFVNLIIVLLCLNYTKKIKSRAFKSLTWIISILLTIFIAIIMHPQEYLPNVITQITKKIFKI